MQSAGMPSTVARLKPLKKRPEDWQPRASPVSCIGAFMQSGMVLVVQPDECWMPNTQQALSMGRKYGMST